MAIRIPIYQYTANRYRYSLPEFISNQYWYRYLFEYSYPTNTDTDNRCIPILSHIKPIPMPKQILDFKSNRYQYDFILADTDTYYWYRLYCLAYYRSNPSVFVAYSGWIWLIFGQYSLYILILGTEYSIFEYEYLILLVWIYIRYLVWGVRWPLFFSSNFI